MDQRTRHLLFVLHTDHRLQHRTQHGVVIGDKLRKLLVLLHRENGDGLEAGFDPYGGPSSLGLAGGWRANRVPLLHKLPPRHPSDGDVDQSHIVVLIFLLLLVRVPVDVHGDAAHSGQAGELKVLAPEETVRAHLAGGASVEHVVQTELAEVLLLGREVLGLDDPQAEDVLRTPTVVLGGERNGK